MSISHDHIRAALDAYLARHPDERGALIPLTEALIAPGHLASRGTFTGHVTCSAVLIDRCGQVLHIHHNALDRLLLPGGHLESTDADLPAAALRELTEETGIPVDAISRDFTMDGMPLDIDIHTIPANPAKSEPEHLHFDFRFAFRTTGRCDIDITLQPEEVGGHRWVEPVDCSSPGVAAKLAMLLSS
ncbi:NUDIX domain-containing protein [Streptosporangium sp. NPDC005286]|uniref:NUDIX hydrolase n=1 Tax=Streptosporangium sp. NPDC005286 TaxID=3154463 RepID=UPI0033BA9DC7